jgi:ferric-dicitrate binding protein FerR (iron transport regulator)
MKQQKINPSGTDDLLIKYLIGSASETEIQFIQSWLSEGKENMKYFDQLKDIYFLGKVTKSPSGFDKEQSLESVKSKYYKLKYNELNTDKIQFTKRINFRIAISVAATFFIAIALGFYFNYLFTPHQNKHSDTAGLFNEIVAPKGSRSVVTLPDGTKVWLNAGSKLKYPMDFLRGNRTVCLTGEAFFDVVKIKDNRFIVKTSDLAIKVWGTKFNVKAYPEEKTIQTTLVEGSVSIQKVKASPREQETYLVPNQTAVFYKAGISGNLTIHDVDKSGSKQINHTSVQVLKKVNTLLYTSWKDEKWVIEGQTLGNLAIELERRYNVKITFESNAIKNYKFNGIFANETFEQLLKIIKLSAPIDFSITNDMVLLKENTASKINYDKYLKR